MCSQLRKTWIPFINCCYNARKKQTLRRFNIPPGQQKIVNSVTALLVNEGQFWLPSQQPDRPSACCTNVPALSKTWLLVAPFVLRCSVCYFSYSLGWLLWPRRKPNKQRTHTHTQRQTERYSIKFTYVCVQTKQKKNLNEQRTRKKKRKKTGKTWPSTPTTLSSHANRETRGSVSRYCHCDS